MAGRMRTKTQGSDIALDQDSVGTRFVTLVVVMMSMLATLAMGGALVVHSLRASWVAGITGHMTIEIPATAPDGSIRDANTEDAIAARINDALAQAPDVRALRILDRREVERMVRPWLGTDADKQDLPLPVLIAVTLNDANAPGAQGRVARAVAAIDASAVTEGHQAWLSDLRRFSLALLIAAFMMAGATVACAILTVAGAVRARLAAHQADIDLLHLMGATDDYIAAQFVRVFVRHVGQAALIGLVGGAVILKAAGMIAGNLQSAALPEFHWGPGAILWLAACPALVIGLGWLAARVTVLRSLRIMP
ncbi:MAG: hypothetical protein KDJ49_06255 [Alphaproteobacteria bacterium]|nr:hypothetical protein [Alphaproteobacteria bacterium]USO07492.1 MAG: hypothetical protein H6866_08775 [Rhodospirillales bacterium]